MRNSGADMEQRQDYGMDAGMSLAEERQITVITVCYNSSDTIRKTIESVLRQTYSRIEYIIIDGASKDGTAETARSYQKQFQKKGYAYRIISEPDRGIYDAMNKGIREASGELVGFINAGDWYEKDAAAAAAREYARMPYDYFYADIRLVRSDGSVIVKHSRPDRFPASRHWNHPSSFCRKQLYTELGGFKCEGIHDDFEFFLRVRKNGGRIRILNKVLANFRTGGISSRKDVSMCRKRIRDRYRGYRENGYSPLCLIECIAAEAVKYVIS